VGRAGPQTPAQQQNAGSLLASIADASQDAIVSVSLEGMVTSWNGAAERLYGYSAAEAMDQRFDLPIEPSNVGDPAALVQIMKAVDGVQHLEASGVRSDGSVIQVAMTMAPIRDLSGQPVGTSAVLHDITELKMARVASLEAGRRVDAADLRSRSEEEAGRARTEVVSLLSHEVRGPLASIVGFTELLYSRDLSERQRKVYLGVMLREGRRLGELINDVLQVERFESGMQKLAFGIADVSALIQRAITASGEDDRRPVGMILPEPLPLVRADPVAISQVLSNFISNSRKFSPVGGSVRIGARVGGGMVRVQIRDEGLGIPPEAVPHLFQKFYRIDSPDRRLIRGSGLGLSLNRMIVEAHGGTVEVHSPGLGRGSTFEFTLPTAGPADTRGEVLIVEDEPSLARVLERELTAQGLTSVWAWDVETATHLLEGSRPRAVLLDLKLPGTQGEEFLTWLRESAHGDLPVVVLTMLSLGPAEIDSLHRIGVTAVLPKEAGAPQAAVTLIAETLAASAGST
jgi:PAS domain S-box-containing protein